MIKLHLAPMEGVVDFVLRDILTEVGGIDHCVTEFIRVTDKLIPKEVLLREAPELKMNSKTRSGVPLFVQFLGGHAQPLAENAAQAVSMGAIGIDLNFGCPAKTVNRHDGGASLLKTPDRIFQIVSAVRKAVPANIPVTAKMRLGFDDPKICFDNAKAIDQAGANWLTIHCRTKTDGYRPPAYWEWIPQIKELVNLPIVANGEIWSVADFQRCVEVTDCQQYMIGRGAIAKPSLFREIKASLNANLNASNPEMSVQEIKNLLPRFFDISTEFKSEYFAQARTKQWLRQISLKFEETIPLFDELKVITKPQIFRSRLENLCQ